MVAGVNDFSAAADGDVIYVNGSGGNDANNGFTPATAKKTIKNATGTVNSGGTVHVSNGIYKGANNRGITLNKSMSILGQSQTSTIIDAEKLNRIFTIIKGVTVTIRNLTLIDGKTNASGGAILNNGTLNVITSTFRGNSAHSTNIGGSNGNGGAIVNNGLLVVTRSTFMSNSARNDIGIGIGPGDSAGGGAIVNNLGTTSVSDSTFRSNLADRNGGAIVNNRGSLSVIGSTFTSNVAHDGGGAIVNGNGTSVVTRSKFTSNTATGNGGAIVNGDGTFTVTGSTFTSNVAHDGAGAIINGFGILRVSGSVFTKNSAAGSNGNGGAIVNGGPRLVTVVNSIFSGNTAREGGGAILNGFGTLRVSHSTFSGNTARQNGGAILNGGGILSVNISNLTRNIARGLGGAIFNDLGNKTATHGTFTVTGSNLTYNTAKNGGAIYNGGGTGVLRFNRIYRNTLKEIASSHGRVDARYNWWGSNRNPSNKVSGNVLVRPWLIATITARPSGSLIVTVSILYDSYGNYHDPSLGHVPDGIPVRFYSSNGIFNPPVSYTINGRATSHYTQTGSGRPVIWAIVDDQILSIGAGGGPVPVNAIPMQDTGVPLNLLLAALAAITGGLLMSRRK